MLNRKYLILLVRKNIQLAKNSVLLQFQLQQAHIAEAVCKDRWSATTYADTISLWFLL